MKKESRVGILSENNKLSCICIFRGLFLEHFILASNKEEVLNRLEKSNVKYEINMSNFGIGKKYSGELENTCNMILEKVSEKINKTNE